MVGSRKDIAQTIVDKRLVRIVAPLMLDHNLAVQNSAIGALRNISLADPDICDHLVEQVSSIMILKPLLNLLNDHISIGCDDSIGKTFATVWRSSLEARKN